MDLDQLPLLLTVEEAAVVMRISRTGAYNAVAEGAVPAIRIGRTIRIPRDRLAEMLGLTQSVNAVLSRSSRPIEAQR